MKITMDQIEKEANLLGFPIVGVIKPDYFGDLKDRLENYRDEGYEFLFNNIDIEEKCNPFLTMEDCKAIIVLGLPYYTEIPVNEMDASKQTPLKGRLARTAWGEDYHRVFHRKMESLGNFLTKNNPKTSYQSYVDTGPLVDRYLASKANLGFYGYNNLFYHQKYGSYVFYGYMLLNQEVFGLKKLSDPGAADLCENCRQCMEACPGEAIEKPYRLNASRCVSGILQKKGIVPDRDKERIGNQIYGCDVCQEVCPYNKEIVFSKESFFIPTSPPAFPDLSELLALTNKEFKEVYGHNASAWRGNRTLKRNALIVMGNSMDSKAIPYIRPFLADTREDLKDAAQWALRKIEGELEE